MDSSEVLLRKEGYGKGYYQRCSAEAGVPGLSRIFTMLSQDEERHADALRGLRNGARVELDRSGTLDGAKYILRHLSLGQAALVEFRGDPAAYALGMDFEAASVRLYGQLAREAAHAWERELFLTIAAEDEIHFALLESMRELLEPPSVRDAAVEGAADAH